MMCRQPSFPSVRAVAVLLGALASAPSHALFNGQNLDPAFCQTKSVRQTVVYIDDTIMVEGKTAWASELIRKLKASLAPGEKTTVVQLSPTAGSSTEIWSGCWPEYTPAQRASIEKSGPYILSKNPLMALSDQQGYFARDLNAAVSVVYFHTKRAAADASASRMAKKQLLRALASDEGRFANSAVTVRAIVYSDMAENSDLGSVFKPTKPDDWVNYAQKLGTHLRKSVFYVFGAGEGTSEDHATMENAKAFWTRALRSMSATVGGFGSDLNVPNGIPVNTWIFDTMLKEPDQELDGKLAILTDGDGNVIDSWIGFNRLDIAGIVGTFHCVGTSCRLDASTTSSLTTDSPSEMLVLSGDKSRLAGTLGVKGTKAMFPLVAVLASR